MRVFPFVVAALVSIAGVGGATDVPIIEEQAGEFRARDLSFVSRVEIEAACDETYKTLTEFARLQKLVPHLHGKAKVARAENVGDTLTYEFERADGTKNTGRMILTTLEDGSRVQVLVQPDDGPWLRVQEFRLYAPAGGKKSGSLCHVVYEETYNPQPLKNAAYDMKAIVEEIREPYMDVILRRLKNISEGKEPGPAEEVKQLREIAKHFP